MNKLVCKEIVVTYILKKKVYVDGLDGLSISFDAGKVNIIMGENGCGKTTLFNCITGILPYDGTILFDDTNANSISTKDRKISYIRQDIALFPKLTIFDNLAFTLKNQKLKSDYITRKIYDVLKDFDIAHLINCIPSQLSIGQVQKVLLAKALISEPEILILDEAFSNVDKQTAKFIQRKISEYTKSKKAITLCVDHDIEDAVTFGDHFFVINNKEVVYESEKDEEIMDKLREHFYYEAKKN